MPRYTLSILWLVLIIVLCWLPQSNIIEPKWFHFPNQDKVVHFTLFLAWVYFLQLDFQFKTTLSLWFFILTLGFSLAFITEYFQPIVSDRTRDWQDGLADMIGILFGLFLFNKKK